MAGTLEDTDQSWIKRYTASDGEVWIIDLGGSYSTYAHHEDFDGSPGEPGYPADQRIVTCSYSSTPEQIAKMVEEWIDENPEYMESN